MDESLKVNWLWQSCLEPPLPRRKAGRLAFLEDLVS